MIQRSNFLTIGEYDPATNSNKPYPVCSVTDIALAKYGQATFLFFRFLRIMVATFGVLASLGVVAAAINLKGRTS